MTLRQYLLIMALGTVICWVAWWLVVSTTDPLTAAFLPLFLFYATLFLALLGTFAVLGFGARVFIFKQNEVIFRNVRKTFRQGVLFAALICGALALKSQGLFKWWIVLLFVLFLFLVEFFFISFLCMPKQKY